MPSPVRTVAIVAARDKQEARQLVPEIAAWLRERGCTVLDEGDLAAGRRADVLVALGGDGLMMRMAHSYPGIPLIGINFGKVGFLAMAERSQWPAVLARLLEGDYRVQEGPTLAAELVRGGQSRDCGWAINDVVVRSGMQMIDIELYVDGQYVNTYPGDGIIVASPQGSTAYCMAAGGPILTAGVHGFAVTPISAHSPIRSTLVVPEESRIELVVDSDREAYLILDGQVIERLAVADVIVVRRGEHQFRLIITPEMSFFSAFQSKFNFLIRPDAVPSRASGRPAP